ncbi:MAG: hypothetical protein JWN15_1292, partial [Firmicutes bacterium]|nr:hypothetical protein [Bacillota bacterium]
VDAAAFLPRGARVQLSDPRQNQPGDVPGPCAVNGWSHITHGWVPTDSIRPVMNSGGAH